MKINLEEEQDIIDRSSQGKSQAEIARELNRSHERIRQRLARHDIRGRNYKWMPERENLLSALSNANSLSHAAQLLKLTDSRLQMAIKQYSASEDLKNARTRWRSQKHDKHYLSRQRPLINQVRELALKLGHTPREEDLQSNGISHMTLVRVFGSLKKAMLASGLKPNSHRLTSPLPSDFGEIAEPTLDFDTSQRRANLLCQVFENLPEPAGTEKPKSNKVTTTSYYRDPKVAGWVLQSANGICEVCGLRGYETDAGISFLETHHIVPLGEGGPDTTWNVIAVCETCHGKLHRWKHREEMQRNLYATVSRLRQVQIAE